MRGPRRDSAGGTGPGPSLDRQILSLAVPALGALIAEPLFVLIDSAMVGHLGATSLAGLALASTVLTTAVGLFVFLAYATTATTARLFGAGDRAGGLRAGVDGIWLSLLLGAVTAVAGWLSAPWLVEVMGARDAVAEAAVAYLRASAPGLPGMLAVLAATGTLRGLLDTRTPFVVASGGAVLNVGLNAVLLYGVGMGVAGSGLGTAVTQTLMGVVLTTLVARAARSASVSLRPHRSGLGASFATGLPLLVRTLSLRAAILLTVWAATALGATELAAHQVVSSLWGFAAFALDALAIAAQALVGTTLGAAQARSGAPGGTHPQVPPEASPGGWGTVSQADGDRGGRVGAVLCRTLEWGGGAGAAIGVVLAALSPLLPRLFTTDPAVHAAATPALLVAAAAMPLAGAVYMLDGVLIGAGDGRYLAVAGMLTLVTYAPLAVLVGRHGSGTAGLVWLWAAFAVVFMATRALTTGLRARGTAWRH